ncbi:hypothetical protein QUB12_11750 [Microcoleus sp. B7-D4]
MTQPTSCSSRKISFYRESNLGLGAQLNYRTFGDLGIADSIHYVGPHILHHSQLAFSEQAFRPVPQENLSFVEQAGKPVLEDGARCEFHPTG